MTKKRFLAMLLTGAMTLSLAACGGTSTGSDAGTDSGADSGSDSYKIALIQQHQTNAFQIAVSEAAEAKAAAADARTRDQQQRLQQGRAATIFTSGEGDTNIKTKKPTLGSGM